MRYVRVETSGAARWGVLRGDDVELLSAAPYAGGELVGKSVRLDSVRLLAPAEPTKVLCLGRNFADHMAEMDMPVTDDFSVFMVSPTAIIGPGDDVMLPPARLDTEVQHESELAIVIGRKARHVKAADYRSVILGYTCADDVTARGLQRSDPHPTRAKGFDTFLPIGPWIETDIDPVAGIGIRLWVNDELRQDGNTITMIHDVPSLIEYMSEFTTLMPGDLILTGCPLGTGPIVAGDRVAIEIDGIGRLEHGVVPADWD